MATSIDVNRPLFLQFLLGCMITILIYYPHNHVNNYSTTTSIMFRSIHPKNFTFANSLNITGKQTRNLTEKRSQPCMILILIILAGDVQTNPGPRNASIFPCGICDAPVTWSRNNGVCCNNCSIWYHKSCEDISKNMSYLDRSSVIWHCCKCDSINVDSFTFNSFELTTSNFFTPLSNLDSTFESVTSSCFSPIHTSSPRSTNNNSNRHSRLHSDQTSTSHHNQESSSTPYPMKNANFRLLTVNCCGIRTNRSEFMTAIEYIKPDGICGTESWLKGVKPGKDPEKNAIKSSEVFPDSLKVNRNDRSDRIGGGVFVATTDNVITDAQPQLVTDCEITWSKLRLKNQKDLYLCSFYMPHRNMNSIKQLSESVGKLTESTKEKQIIVAGDFNCPNINWDNLTVEKGASDRDVQQALIDFATEHSLTQIHHQPTRDNNILDLVFTSNPSLIKTSTSVPGISDHAMVVTDIDIIPHYVKQKRRKIFQFNKANWDDINKDLENLSADLHRNEDQNIEQLWNLFKEKIQEVITKHVPSKMSSKRKSLPWFSHKLKRMIKKKTRLFKMAKSTGNWTHYKTYQRECKKEFKRAEIQHINSTIETALEENNSKPFWRYVKSRRQDHIGVQPLKSKGQLFNNNKDKAQILVDQFKSVFTKHNNTKPDTSKRPKFPLKPLTITTKGIDKLLSSINVNKARGPDDIPNIVLKNCTKTIAPALQHIFQTSVNTGKLPSDWLSANITPVYKKGDSHLAENYRPVSLTCVTCKLLEHIICKHILDHLEKNNILTSLNHGFRSGYSCETQLLTTVHHLLQMHDEGDQIDVVILDFSKAFDTVPHESLLHKMDQYGIGGNINNWLRDFLTNRTMRVVVEGEASEAVPVDSGVPQGTVLGPLAFLCHINDLPECVKSSVRLFADDCLLYRSIKSRQDHIDLQSDLSALEKWAETWGMRFNAKKCYVMSINNKSSNFYQLNDHILQQVQENPYLGITLSEDMKFNKHISKITNKASSTLGFLKRNLKHCPPSCRKTAYLSLVRSTLEYSSIVWDPYLLGDSNMLEKVQRKATRFITGDYKSRDSGCITKMLQQLNLPTLQDRRKMARLTFLYKVAEGLVPAMPANIYLEPISGKRQIRPKRFTDFTSANPVTRSAINHQKCFKPIQCNRDIYKHSFFPRTIIDWNNLDTEVVSAQTVQGFKTALLKRD